MEFLNDYVVLLVFAACLCVGYILKNVVLSEKIDRFIPLILGILGVVVNLWINAWAATPEIVVGGLFSGLASTGANQAFRQIIGGFGGKTEE